MSIRSPVLTLIISCCASLAQADELTLRKFLLFDKIPDAQDHVRLVASPYTLHFSPSERHKPVWMIGAEKQYADGDVLGAAYFSNSFGQDSLTVYRGEQIRNWSRFEKLYFQWTAGLMYGYKGEFQDEVPLNFKGFSPVVVVSLGWQFTPKYSVQVNLLGFAAAMVQVSMRLP
ncbi:MAG: hypothetical protein OEY03_16435 [Rhizobacter sp.]|nr:hypothetical protein [Rhizobacter sp.]